MNKLSEHDWPLSYSLDDGNLAAIFYTPALSCAVRYDRMSGYFTADALALAMNGVQQMIANNGRMRLIVGCTLSKKEVDAIIKGEDLRAVIDHKMLASPLTPSSEASQDALELLAWMVAYEFLTVRIAVTCDADRKPTSDQTIFHAKSGLITDCAGDKIAWSGSNNETAEGWRSHWEYFNLFSSWREPPRVRDAEERFNSLWNDRAERAIVFEVPEAMKKKLLQFLPPESKPPALLQETETDYIVTPSPPPSQTKTLRLLWSYIRHAAAMPGGDEVGAATCAVSPWPHQKRAFGRMWNQWPPRLLIADEVGLGKTVQAGMLLRQALLSDKAKRILILTPKAVLRQWQLELAEKFNLFLPIYDRGGLQWYDAPYQSHRSADWHDHPAVLMSSQLMRRRKRQAELVGDENLAWDLIILDEAHHARVNSKGAPNTLLSLMRQLAHKTKGLLLLSATPMQLHVSEIHALLALLHLPPAWDSEAFEKYFQLIQRNNLSHHDLAYLARLFRETEKVYGQMDEKTNCPSSRLFARKTAMRALRNSDSNIPLQKMDADKRGEAMEVLRYYTPIRALVSRHTRHLLRRYQREGLLSDRIAERNVTVELLAMHDDEQCLYKETEDYIRRAYQRAPQANKNATGFLLTIYRRRLASSVAALRETLIKRKEKIDDATIEEESALSTDWLTTVRLADSAEVMTTSDLEHNEIERLLTLAENCGEPAKLSALRRIIAELAGQGYSKVMVFTQYTDTMRFLRDELRQTGDLKIMCYSGDGGEVPESGQWRIISRAEAKRRFREEDDEVLLCTDAAAEGLNFQFCGALINYDMPWNPMLLEQRIGRIDRIGQRFDTVRVVNLLYNGTVEADVYRALGERIQKFKGTIGALQPILFSGTEKLIREAFLSGHAADTASYDRMEDEVRNTGLDLDEACDSLSEDAQKRPAFLTLPNLDAMLKSSLLPPGAQLKRLGSNAYELILPGMETGARITTDVDYYERHAGSVHLWSPGNPLFQFPPDIMDLSELSPESDFTAIFHRLLRKD